MTPYAKEITAVVILKLLALFFLWWFYFSSFYFPHSHIPIKQFLLDVNNSIAQSPQIIQKVYTP